MHLLHVTKTSQSVRGVVYFEIIQNEKYFSCYYISVSHLIVSNEVNVNTTLLRTVLPIWQK